MPRRGNAYRERLGTSTATPGSADFANWVAAMVAAGRARGAEIAG